MFFKNNLVDDYSFARESVNVTWKEFFLSIISFFTNKFILYFQSLNVLLLFRNFQKKINIFNSIQNKLNSNTIKINKNDKNEGNIVC